MGAPQRDFRDRIVAALRTAAALATAYAGGDATEWAKHVEAGEFSEDKLPAFPRLPAVVVGQVELDDALSTYESDDAKAPISILCRTARARFGGGVEAYDLARDVLVALRAALPGCEAMIDGAAGKCVYDAKTRNVLLTLQAPLSVLRTTVD